MKCGACMEKCKFDAIIIQIITRMSKWKLSNLQ
ncbi:MAG: hypothetical protein MZV63_16315 [Marinilabiliales bacterium]|nr:hypothetical protein [Marinilabiliales bacterium]